MRDSDAKEFARVFAAMCEYYGREPSQALMELYWNLLKDWELEAFKAAAEAAMRTQRFFPKVADLEAALYGGTESRAVVGWETLLRAIRETGAHGSVLFEDSTITRVVELMGGWESVCSWRTEDLKWRQKEFLGMYEALAHQSGRPRVLWCSHDARNMALGFREHVGKPDVYGTSKAFLEIGWRKVVAAELGDDHGKNTGQGARGLPLLEDLANQVSQHMSAGDRAPEGEIRAGKEVCHD